MTKRLLLPLMLATLAVPAAAEAQVPYRVIHGSEAYTPIAGGTTHPRTAFGAFPASDEGVAAIPIPFTFNWYGVGHTTVYAYTNGLLSFQQPTTMGLLRPPRTVPDPNNVIHDFIGVIWQDLEDGQNAAVRSRVDGAPGSRVLTIQYENFVRTNAPAPQSLVNFQVRLFEGTHAVEIVYGPLNGIIGATAAIENANGTQGSNLMAPSPTCSGNCPCAPATCSSNTNFGNAGGRRIRIELPNQAEVQGTVLAPPGAYPGASFDADVTVFNAGLSAAGPFDYQLLLATSTTSLAGAVPLGTFSVPGLAPVTAIGATHSLTVPPATPPGTYRIALSVDVGDAVTEVDEANNVSFSGPFRTEAELVGSVTGPNQTGPGEPFDVQLELRSEGAPVSTPVDVQFYLSPTPTVGPGAVAVTPPQSVTLPDGFEASQTLTLTAPLGVSPSPPGYYVVAEVDPQDAIVEADETNNVFASPATLDVRGPDLAATAFAGGDFGFRGRPYPLRAEIENVGAATARDFTVCVFLSDNPLISVISDLQLVETGLMTLAPGESRTVRLEPTIPASTSTGAWHVAAVADCATVVDELVETNNTQRRGAPITVIDPAPDFTPLSVRTASAGAAGEALPVEARIANVGPAAGQTRVRFVLSDNPGITAQDAPIFETASPVMVAPTEEVTVSAWASLPADLPTGSYYVGVLVDPADDVAEVREDDNARGVGPILIEGADLAIVSPAPPNPVVGNAYAWRFAAAGGAGDYAWSLTWDSGQAPAGLAFDAARGELAGTPSAEAEGSHGFTLRVSSGGRSVEARYNLLIAPSTLPLTVVSSRLPPAVAGETYSVQLVAAGGVPPYRWSLGSVAPPGINVAPGGVLGGEPQLVGPVSLTVVVRDQSGQRATGRLSIEVVDPEATITITTADVPTGVTGEAYQTAFNATGGQRPYTWTLSGDAVPGLTFDGPSAQLVGTPTVAGAYDLVVEVRDASGLIDRNGYVLEIFEEGALRIVTDEDDGDRLPDGTLGEPYLDRDGEPVVLRAEPPAGTTWFVANGRLPPGLTLEARTGRVSGAPTEAGAFAFTVLVTNEANDFRRRSLVISVEDPADAPPPVDEGGCACAAPRGGAPMGAIALLGLLWLSRRERRR